MLYLTLPFVLKVTVSEWRTAVSLVSEKFEKLILDFTLCPFERGAVSDVE